MDVVEQFDHIQSSVGRSTGNRQCIHAHRPASILHTRARVARNGDALSGVDLFPNLNYAKALQATAPRVKRHFDCRVQTYTHCDQQVTTTAARSKFDCFGPRGAGVAAPGPHQLD